MGLSLRRALKALGLSAKEQPASSNLDTSFPHSPVTLPTTPKQDLPPELWFAILEHAVHVPDLFDTTWAVSPEERLWEGHALHSMPRESLHTRKMIVLVSRAWWRMGRRFLYENVHVNLREPKQVLAVLHQLKARLGEGHDQQVADASAVPCGWWVKRLFVAGHGGYLNHDDVSDVLRLLKACFHIRVLWLAIGCELSTLPQLCQLLESRFAHSLRAITLRSGGAFAEGAKYPHGWPELPKLPFDSMTIPTGVQSRSSFDHPLPPVAFSNLTTLVLLGSTANHVPAWHLPTLRYLHLMGPFHDPSDSCIPFFEVNGPQLLGLRLSLYTSGSHARRLLMYTTSLRACVLDDRVLDTFHPSVSPTYPSVTHLGLMRRTNKEAQGDYFHRIEQGLSSLLPQRLFPNLRTVRLLGMTSWDILGGDWGRVIRMVEQYGIGAEIVMAE